MRRLLPVTICCSLLLAGCATPENQGDPLEGLNRQVYRFNSAVDKAALKPLAQGYAVVVPRPARTGVHNFFSNIGDVFVSLNNLLQGHPNQTASDIGRMVINSTVGVVGLVDVASKMGLEKHDADFGQTLGKWGLGPGPYLVLPFFGSTTLRDSADIVANTALYQHISPEASTRDKIIPVRILDTRAQLLGVDSLLESSGPDEYAFVRSTYLQGRQNKIGGTVEPAPLEDDPGPTPEAPASDVAP